jgi:hypothetical protein
MMDAYYDGCEKANAIKLLYTDRREKSPFKAEKGKKG